MNDRELIWERYILKEMISVYSVKTENPEKLWFKLIDRTKLEISDDYSKYRGEQGNIDLVNKIIYFSTKDLSKSYALNVFAHIKVIKDCLKAISTKLNLNGYKVYSGRYGLHDLKDTDFVGVYPDILKLEDPTNSQTLVLYHGTNSAYLNDIKKHGLRSTFDTSVKQWNTSGRYYINKQPIYLSANIERAYEYAESSFRNNPKGEPIVLKITIPKDESKLFADDDWLDLQQNKNLHAWRESLKETGQLVYLGRISPSFIQLEYPKKLRPILDINFKKIDSVNDINYADTLEDAINVGLSNDKIFKSLKEFSDYTFDMDEWHVIKETQNIYDHVDEVIKIGQFMDNYVIFDADEIINQYEGVDKYYEDIEELIKDYKENDEDFSNIFEFDETEEEEKENLYDCVSAYQRIITNFLNWRASLFK